MTAELGHLALILALLVALVQGTLPLLGAHRGHAAWIALHQGDKQREDEGEVAELGGHADEDAHFFAFPCATSTACCASGGM